MPRKLDLSPLQQSVLAAAICLAGLGVALACGAGSRDIPYILQCQADALRVLPKDPDMATVADLKDIIGRLRVCHVLGADAGAP